ncbi:MAG: hypothetical protein ACREJ3_05185, partial [Polyangiaceae bacterium]
QHAHIADLAAVAHALMARAVEKRGTERQAEWVSGLAGERHLTREDAATPFGNALDVLDRGPEDASERALACALAAHAIAQHPPATHEDQERRAQDILWLAAHTPFDATGLLDRALGVNAEKLWSIFAEHVRRFDRAATPSLDRGEVLVAALSLASSGSAEAARRAPALAAEMSDRRIASMLTDRRSPDALGPFVGEMTSAPRGPIATAILGVSGLLLLVAVGRLFGRIALAYGRPAEVDLSPDGDVRVRWQVRMLGKTLRDRDVVVPRTALASATRDVRFAGVGLYAGLLALVVGSTLGMSTFVDGVRAASPALLVTGIAVIAAGLVTDFVLSCLAPVTRGQCRMDIVLRSGARLCVARIDVADADVLLGRLAGH